MDHSVNGPDGESGGEGRGIIRTHHDWSETPPSNAVVRTVAIAADRGPLELSPLYDSVDPDALDQCVRSLGGSTGAAASAVTFRFGDRTVAVHGSGQVLAWPVDRRERSPPGG